MMLPRLARPSSSKLREILKIVHFLLRRCHTLRPVVDDRAGTRERLRSGEKDSYRDFATGTGHPRGGLLDPLENHVHGREIP